MSYELIFHPEAEKEYAAAYRWYENEQLGLGIRFEKMVGQKLEQIQSHPENYHFGKASYREVATEFFFTLLFINSTKEGNKFISLLFVTQTQPKHKYRK